MATPDMARLKNLVAGISDIPANEQCLGHFHQAVQDAFRLVIEEIERLNKITGTYSA